MDAHVALLTVMYFNYLSFPFGIGIAATIRVGNLLGADRPVAARAAGWCAILLGGVSMAACAIVIAAARGRLALIFIHDATVQRALGSIALLGAAAELFEGVYATALVRRLPVLRPSLAAPYHSTQSMLPGPPTASDPPGNVCEHNSALLSRGSA